MKKVHIELMGFVVFTKVSKLKNKSTLKNWYKNLHSKYLNTDQEFLTYPCPIEYRFLVSVSI